MFQSEKKLHFSTYPRTHKTIEFQFGYNPQNRFRLLPIGFLHSIYNISICGARTHLCLYTRVAAAAK